MQSTKARDNPHAAYGVNKLCFGFLHNICKPLGQMSCYNPQNDRQCIGRTSGKSGHCLGDPDSNDRSSFGILSFRVITKHGCQETPAVHAHLPDSGGSCASTVL